MNQKRPNPSQYQQVPQPQFQQYQEESYEQYQYDQYQYQQQYPVDQTQYTSNQYTQPQQYQQPAQQFQQPVQYPNNQPQPQYQHPPQPQYQQPTDYFKEFQTSATGQIGMQLGSQALSQAQQQISSNVGRYFDINQWRYYFNVSNSYVFNKLRLLLFPFLRKSWARVLEHSDGGSSYAPPRSDLNAPDLYIPVMSFVTYVILVGISTGLNAKQSTTITYD